MPHCYAILSMSIRKIPISNYLHKHYFGLHCIALHAFRTTFFASSSLNVYIYNVCRYVYAVLDCLTTAENCCVYLFVVPNCEFRLIYFFCYSLITRSKKMKKTIHNFPFILLLYIIFLFHSHHIKSWNFFAVCCCYFSSFVHRTRNRSAHIRYICVYTHIRIYI